MQSEDRHRSSQNMSSSKPLRKSNSKNPRIDLNHRYSHVVTGINDSLSKVKLGIFSNDDAQLDTNLPKVSKAKNVRLSEHRSKDDRSESLTSPKSNSRKTPLQEKITPTQLNSRRSKDSRNSLVDNSSHNEDKDILKKELMNSFKLDVDFIEQNYTYKMISNTGSYLILSEKNSFLDRVSNAIKSRERTKSGNTPPSKDSENRQSTDKRHNVKKRSSKILATEPDIVTQIYADPNDPDADSDCKYSTIEDLALSSLNSKPKIKLTQPTNSHKRSSEHSKRLSKPRIQFTEN